MEIERFDLPTKDSATENAYARQQEVEKRRQESPQKFKKRIAGLINGEMKTIINNPGADEQRSEALKLLDSGDLDALSAFLANSSFHELKKLVVEVDPPIPLTDSEIRLIQEFEDRTAEFKRTHHLFGDSDITDDLVKTFIIFHRGGVRFKFQSTNYDSEANAVLDRLKKGECRNHDGSVYSYAKAREELIGDLKYRGRWVAN
ncbi:hypothetical protein [Pseudomonas koreensis]|uniref:hypothetical protein n=1 Tax=Pseudomonas koreensis TaxID=198620 RepID=UPI0014735FC8|nr:hypothetical protein [Pseudomonas koreensis]NNA55405.1 hypothetical protein [Pseudomonas koreensis]